MGLFNANKLSEIFRGVIEFAKINANSKDEDLELGRNTFTLIFNAEMKSLQQTHLWKLI